MAQVFVNLNRHRLALADYATADFSHADISYALVTRNSGSPTLYLRHGKAPTLAELASYTFNSVVLADGTVLKDLTFADLVAQTWSLVNKS